MKDYSGEASLLLLCCWILRLSLLNETLTEGNYILKGKITRVGEKEVNTYAMCFGAKPEFKEPEPEERLRIR